MNKDNELKIERDIFSAGIYLELNHIQEETK
jgi:hypothetical protein